MKKLVVLFSICFLLAKLANSETLRELCLEKAIELALKNNQSLKLLEKKINASNAKKIEMFGKYLPSISISGSWTKLSLVPTINMPPFFGGGSIKFGSEESFLIRATVSQPIFTFGKIRQANNQARYGFELAEEDYRKTKKEIIFNTKKAFFSVLLAEKFVHISEEAVGNLKYHYQVTNKLYEEGRVSKYDVSRVKVQLVNSETQLIKSRNELKLAKKMLKNIINASEVEDIENIKIVGELSEDKIGDELKDFEYYKDCAIHNSSELKQIDLQEKMSRSLLKLTVAENLPNISFVGNSDYQKPYYFVDEWKSVQSAMVMFNYPILDGLGFSNYGKIKSAKLNLEQVRLLREQVKQSVELEIEKTYLDLVEAKEKIQLQKENVENAKENLRIAQERYAKGLISDIEVKDNQLALTQAEVNYYQAYFDYQIAVALLEKQIGGIK